GLGLLGLLGSGPEGDLFQRARDVKRRIGEQLRVPLPPLTVTDDPSLPVSTYVISCQGQEAARGRLMMSRALVTADGDAPLPDGVPAERPTGENAVWVERDALPLSGQRGWRVQTPCEVLLADLQRALRQRVTAFVGRDAAHEFVERVRAQRPVLVSELEQAGVGLGAVRQVMTGLAEEGVPLSDPAAILEAVADAAPEAKHPTQLIEAARRAVAPSITRACASADGVIKVVALGRNVERYVLESLEAAEPGRPVTLPPRVVRSLRDEIARLRARCLLCTPEARRSVWESLRDFVPDLKVVVPDELVGSARVRVLGEADCPADIVYEAQRAAAGAHTVGSESH
ncbi:MAG: FHIPEP family type III secretion protein, partial [Armatimonadota bacterium]